MSKQLARPDDGDRPERARPRKPIQVATSVAIGPSDDTLETIVVLCNDGTLWRDDVMLKDGCQHLCWTRLPDIPQEDN